MKNKRLSDIIASIKNILEEEPMSSEHKLRIERYSMEYEVNRIDIIVKQDHPIKVRVNMNISPDKKITLTPMKVKD